MDYIGATPMQNPLLGLLAERLKQAQEFAAKPFGYSNPPAEMLMNLLGVPAVQQTAERIAYGDPLTTGRGMTTQIRPEAVEAALTVAPAAGLLGKATKGMPVGMSIKPVDDVAALLSKEQKFSYPQEEAMRLAQKRAALPVSEGGLGLKPDNTAAERAKAMGFDIESLHGTANPNIEKFDPSLVGTKAGNAFDNYMWSTTNPDAATGYSLNMKSYESLPEVVSLKEQKNDILKQIAKAVEAKDTEKVGELRSQLNSIHEKESTIFDVFKQGQIISEGSTVYPLALQRQEFMPYEAGGKSWMRANRPAIEQSQDLGYQGVQINNVVDNPNSFMGNVPATTFATENPDLLRSRFAAFDPYRRTAAIASAMGVAAPDLLAEEEKPKKKRKNLLD